MKGRRKATRAASAPARMSRERGSALLIIFVFAAMVAIMLYMELPVAAFEAHRQKEQILIDRGNEYAHAVKLYVRKFGSYPPSMEALEDTNRMRFLRHRFKDPFTGKDDWRILHAGPGGMLVDSKVNPISNTPNANGRNSTAGNSRPFSSSTDSGFGLGFASGSSSSSSTAEVVVPQVPQRPPALAANSGGAPQAAGASDPNLNPLLPLPQPGQNATAAQLAPTANVNPAVPSNTGTAPNTGVAGGGLSSVPGQTNPQAPVAGAAASADPGNPMQPVQGLLKNPNPMAPQNSAPAQGPASTFGQGSSGRINTGGIAGVASKAEGHSIKTINDQSDYSLWEFYYDPSKDPMRGLGGVRNQAGQPVNPNGAAFGANTSESSPTPVTETPTPATPTTPSNPPQ